MCWNDAVLILQDNNVYSTTFLEPGFVNARNSRQNFKIPALLQGGSICLVSLVKGIWILSNSKESGFVSNSRHSRWNFEIPGLLQGSSRSVYLVSLVKYSEWSNKNWRRSSDLKQKLMDDGWTTDNDRKSVIPLALLWPSVNGVEKAEVNVNIFQCRHSHHYFLPFCLPSRLVLLPFLWAVWLCWWDCPLSVVIDDLPLVPRSVLHPERMGWGSVRN